MTGTNLEANDKKTYARLPLPLVKCVDAELAPPTETFLASTIVDILLKATVWNVLYSTKWSGCSEVRNRGMVHRLEMVLYYTITLKIFDKGQAKTFYLKNHYCLLTNAWHILLGWLILNYTNNLKSYVWSFCLFQKLQNVRDIWVENIFLAWKSKWSEVAADICDTSIQLKINNNSIFVYWYMNGVIIEKLVYLTKHKLNSKCIKHIGYTFDLFIKHEWFPLGKSKNN